MSKKRRALARVVVPFVLKADVDPESRTFEGLAATWDQDLGNDIIHRGAFKKTLSDWKSSGDALPLLNSHNHYDIFSAIGQMVDGKETKDGLWTKWEVIDGPDGDKVLDRLRPSTVTGRPIIGKMSIGFLPTKYTYEQPKGTDSYYDRLRHVTEAMLKETSLVLFPMNPNAVIDATSVKMFMQSLDGMDSRGLTSLDRLQFRKLASRIGVLLQAPPTSTKQDDDDEDDMLEMSEHSSQSDSSADDPSAEDDSDDDAADDHAEDSPATKADSDQVVVYQMSEALSHRLQRLRLSNRTSALSHRREA